MTWMTLRLPIGFSSFGQNDASTSEDSEPAAGTAADRYGWIAAVEEALLVSASGGIVSQMMSIRKN